MTDRLALALVLSTAWISGCSGDDSATPGGDAGPVDSGHDATTIADASEGTGDAADPILTFDAGSDADAGPPDAACAPLPGCTSPASCAEGNGCDVCTCTSQFWVCPMLACDGGSDALDGSIDAGATGDSGFCPEGAPAEGAACEVRDDVVCSYGTKCPIGDWACADGGWLLLDPTVGTCPPSGDGGLSN